MDGNKERKKLSAVLLVQDRVCVCQIPRAGSIINSCVDLMAVVPLVSD